MGNLHTLVPVLSLTHFMGYFCTVLAVCALFVRNLRAFFLGRAVGRLAVGRLGLVAFCLVLGDTIPDWFTVVLILGAACLVRNFLTLV